MDNRTGSMNDCGGRPHHFMGFLPLVILPLSIGMLLAMKRHVHMQGMHVMRGMRGMHGRQSWENGVPPFFAELHRRAHAAESQPPVTEA